jgi:UDP-N-acetylmuramoyl-tripeptide--D-alanyl-D-alanine ligase
VYLWQVKEYRLDRIWSHWFIEKSKGIRSEVLVSVKIALATTIVFFLLSPSATVLIISIVLSFVINWAESFVFFQKIPKGKFLRPSLKSFRNLIIFFLNLILLSGLVLIFLNWIGAFNISNIPTKLEVSDNFSWINNVPSAVDGRSFFPIEFLILIYASLGGILLEILSPIVTGFGVLITFPLALIKRKIVIERAKKKFSSLKKIKTVAVTGSYGKSTTKELIYQLLDPKFKVVKTQKNNNTDIGVAQTILKDVSKNTEVFIAEMGAYKIGEIKDICDIAQPDIAVVTGIDQQHVTLYGGIPQILKSSYEVIEALKPDGLSVLNGDNEYCIKLAEKTRKRKKLYFSIRNSEKMDVVDMAGAESKQTLLHKVTFPGNENIFVSEIFETSKGLSFKLNFDKESYQVNSNLKVIYNISNLLSAVLCAFELGMTMQEIVDEINGRDFKVPYLNIYDGINGSKILDDGYNINPTGFMAAIKFLDSLKIKGKKWIMTQGMIELGDERVQIYRKVAQLIVKKIDYLYTSDKYLIEEVKNLDPDFKAVLVNSVFDYPIYYKALVKKDQIVLLEGAFPQIVLDKIYKGTRI